MDDPFKRPVDLSPTGIQRTVGALRQAESRYQRLFETARDGILLINAETGQIEDVNPYLIEMLGYTHAEFLGKKLWEVGPFVDVTQSREMFETAQALGYVRYDDLPLQAKSGATIAVEFVSNSYDCEGVKVIQCNVRDISDRKAIEARAQQLADLYAALSVCNKAIVHCTDEETLCQEVCRAAVQHGGMTAAWVGRIAPDTGMLVPVAVFGSGTDVSEARQFMSENPVLQAEGPTGHALQTGKPYWCQNFRTDPLTLAWRDELARLGWEAGASLPLRRGGAVTGAFVLYSAQPDIFDTNARELLLEMASDISFAFDTMDRESRRDVAEQRLIASEERFRRLVEQSVSGIYIVQDGKISYANPRCAELVGVQLTSDLTGSDPLQWIAAADRGAIAERIRLLLAGNALTDVLEFDLVHTDGSTVQVVAHAVYAIYEDQPAILGSIRDISDRKRAEKVARRYIAQLKAAVMSTVDVATTIGEMRDPYTAGHERRVAGISVAIAVEMGLDTDVQEGLNVAGHLHDIGKVVVPSEILSKPGKLSAIEMELVKGHAQAGYDVLKSVDFPWPVAEAVLQHHERLDGSGYPSGLRGNAISLQAQILAVADVVEAVSSHRPYRPALGIEAALAEIERGSGTAFAVEVVDACLRLFREKNFQIPA